MAAPDLELVHPAGIGGGEVLPQGSQRDLLADDDEVRPSWLSIPALCLAPGLGSGRGTEAVRFRRSFGLREVAVRRPATALPMQGSTLTGDGAQWRIGLFAAVSTNRIGPSDTAGLERKQPRRVDSPGGRMRVLLPFQASSARDGVGRYRISTKQNCRSSLASARRSSQLNVRTSALTRSLARRLQDVLCQVVSELAVVGLPSSASRSALRDRPVGDGTDGPPPAVVGANTTTPAASHTR